MADLMIITKIQPSRSQSRSCILNWALHKNLGYRWTDIVLHHTQADTSNVFHFWCELWLDAFLFNQHTHIHALAHLRRAQSHRISKTTVFFLRSFVRLFLSTPFLGRYILFFFSHCLGSFHFEFNSKLANGKKWNLIKCKRPWNRIAKS